MERFIDALVMVTLFEMMVTIGLAVTIAELVATFKSWRLLVRAGVANYVVVPAVTVGLLVWFDVHPMVAAGFLILAVCPGAPFAPSVAVLARGDVAAATGLMVTLAGSSAIAAPLLLGLLLPLMAGDLPLSVEAGALLRILVVTQLLPLVIGLAIHQRWPSLAARLRTPAVRASHVLSIAAGLLVLATNVRLLADVRLRGLVGMTVLLALSLAAGWLLGGPGGRLRRTVALTTSLRNVGVGLAIVVGSFAGTAAVTAVVAYFIVEVLGSLLVAWWWSVRPGATPRPVAVNA